MMFDFVQNERVRPVLPLELKTGRTTRSAEHKGQVSTHQAVELLMI